MNNTGVKVQAKGQVTIPLKIRKKWKLKKGDLVVFVETNDGVVVKPASVITDDVLAGEVKSLVQSIREKFGEYSTEEIDALVEEAIRETRGKGS